MLGGFAAMAESAWMGSVQATEVLEPIRTAPAARRGQVVIPKLPRLTDLLTREFTIAEASFILMASFFLSAALGAVRQVLFNAQFGVGTEANAYYAAFRLPDTLFSLIAGGALSSAMIPVLLSTIREEGEEAGGRLINLVLTILLAFFALIVLIGEIFAPAFVNGLLAPGFDPATSALDRDADPDHAHPTPDSGCGQCGDRRAQQPQPILAHGAVGGQPQCRPHYRDFGGQAVP